MVRYYTLTHTPIYIFENLKFCTTILYYVLPTFTKLMISGCYKNVEISSLEAYAHIQYSMSERRSKMLKYKKYIVCYVCVDF